MNAYFRIIQPQEMCPIVPQLALPGLSQPLCGSWAVLEAIKYQLGLASDIQNHLLLFDGLQPRNEILSRSNTNLHVQYAALRALLVQHDQAGYAHR